MTFNYQQHEIGRNSSVDIDISTGLNALEPDERAMKANKFLKHFDAIEAALAREATKTKVLRVLVESGLSLSVNTFNKMLKAERARRAKLHSAHEMSDDHTLESTTSNGLESAQ